MNILLIVAAVIFFVVAIIEGKGRNWIAWGLLLWLLASTQLLARIR